MHVRLRLLGKPETVIVVESKLSKIEQFRRIIKDKFDVEPKLQRLFYGGKLLEDGYTFHDYNIKLNDVIQLMVKVQPDAKVEEHKEEDKENNEQGHSKRSNVDDFIYKDAESTLYAVGDFIDIQDRENGAWFEGKIVRIVYDPDAPEINSSDKEQQSSGKEIHATNKLSNKPVEKPDASKKKSLVESFNKASKHSNIKRNGKNITESQNSEENLLYKVQFDADEEDSDMYCKLKEIRPRARNIINIKDLKVAQRVMINHNLESFSEKGYWYDFKVDEIKKLRTSYELIGTLYLGPDAVPQNDTKVRVHDKIFSIEEVVPLNQRTEEYKRIIATPPEKRSLPYNCSTCRDDENILCRNCGCYVCRGKESPDKIILCDECDNGYHMHCLKPALIELPEEDWYCPSCKRDPHEVIAPGAAKQRKKASTTKRDWGRGMACVGKTKTCAMPANHFGPIPGIDVGMCWRFRIQLSESGVHRPPVSGIHGRDTEGAYSIVLSGGYEDDVDNGNEFTYTGSGGRDLSGNKRTAEQSCDQTLTRENKALARNCAVAQVSESGADAGEHWRDGRPVRVVRSYKMLKHFPKYAPQEGIRYDGIYKVVKYYPEKGLSGYRVWKYLLRRDDPNPAPWEPHAKQYPMIYPDGYLEAEAEKKALKEKSAKSSKKKVLQESNNSQTELDTGSSVEKITRNGKPTKRKAAWEDNNSPTESDSEQIVPEKKRRKQTEIKRSGAKRGRPSKYKFKNSTMNIVDIFQPVSKVFKNKDKTEPIESVLTAEETEAIEADTLNCKLWKECVEISEKQGKKEFVEHVTQVFLCIICQEVAVSPVTTSCLHNFCMACIKLAFKSTGAKTCPYCRQNIAEDELEPNEKLKIALRTILTGYDAGKK